MVQYSFSVQIFIIVLLTLASKLCPFSPRRRETVLRIVEIGNVPNTNNDKILLLSPFVFFNCLTIHHISIFLYFLYIEHGELNIESQNVLYVSFFSTELLHICPKTVSLVLLGVARFQIDP